MTTLAQRVISLLSRCEEQVAYLKDRSCPSERVLHQVMGRCWTLEDVLLSRLNKTTPSTPPMQVYAAVEGVLDKLAEEKAHWLRLGIKKCDPARLSIWQWTGEGVIAQINELVFDLWDLLSPEWNGTVKKHGCYFRVYHCVDHEAMFDVEKSIKCWCSLHQTEAYREVALLKVETATPLEGTYRLTNHPTRSSWLSNREVLWFGEMPLRSTSLGDIIVSLLSGCTWVVDHVGFRVVEEPNCSQKKALRACDLLTQCGSVTDENVPIKIKTFFEELGVMPSWVEGRYSLSERQLSLIGLMERVPDLGNWYREE